MTGEHDGGIAPLTATDPARIGPYLLLGRLGAGGMGRVYLARSEAGRTVAVKVVHEEHVAEPRFRARFKREIAAARRVGERFTAPVIDAAPDGEFPWVATGYVPGLSLEQVVRGHGALPAASVLVLAQGLLHALQDIHAAGIVHRDLKPSNVMLTAEGPKVIDFGIARAIETSVESLLTSTGMVIGSPGFMAPEQIRGQAAGPACDVFTLGCVLTYAATGTLPFGQGVSNQHAVMYRIVEAEPDLDAVEDAGLRDLIGRCLIKSPDERPSVAALLGDLEGTSRDDGAWLPAEVMGRLARQSARILEAEAAPVREETVDRGTVDLRPRAAAPAAQPQRRRRRRVLVVSVPVVLVLATGGGTVALLQPFGDDGGTHATPPPQSATNSASPSASSSPSGSPAKGDKHSPSPSPSPSRTNKKSDAGKDGSDGKDGRDGADAEGSSGPSAGGGGSASEGGGSASGGGGSASGSAGSGSSDGGGSGGGTAGDAAVPASFVGSWVYGEAYNTGQPGTIGITSSGTVRLSDVPNLSCSYEGRVTATSNGGSRIDVGASRLVGANPGYCRATLDASYYTLNGSGIQHNVGPASGDGYYYRRG
ncbi:serine/threonine-protein kinase [Streptomyces sp. NPDC052225]|uniref:serine/threonine-protein kinase n=1 Tax=Streptomyces sp. NPDC052225 TaxID=3154949 RepID=UPI0034322D73